MLKAVSGKGNRVCKGQEGRQNLAHLKNCQYLIPWSPGSERGGRSVDGMEKWAGPGTVTRRYRRLNLKRSEMPRASCCLLLGQEMSPPPGAEA